MDSKIAQLEERYAKIFLRDAPASQPDSPVNSGSHASNPEEDDVGPEGDCQSGIRHGRVAMLAAVGFLISEPTGELPDCFSLPNELLADIQGGLGKLPRAMVAPLAGMLTHGAFQNRPLTATPGPVWPGLAGQALPDDGTALPADADELNEAGTTRATADRTAPPPSTGTDATGSFTATSSGAPLTSRDRAAAEAATLPAPSLRGRLVLQQGRELRFGEQPVHAHQQ